MKGEGKNGGEKPVDRSNLLKLEDGEVEKSQGTEMLRWTPETGKKCEIFLTAFILKLLATIVTGCLLAGAALAANDRSNSTMVSTTTENNRETTEVFSNQEYPYPPRELWKRLVQLVATAPEALDYAHFGKILNVEFDEEKVFWLKSEHLDEPRKYFSVSNNSLAPSSHIPLLLRFDVFPTNDGGRIYLTINLFNKENNSTPMAQSSGYCLTPDAGDLKRLGYHYSRSVSLRIFFELNQHGNGMASKDYYIVSEDNHLNNYIALEFLPNKCLAQFNYVREFK